MRFYAKPLEWFQFVDALATTGTIADESTEM